VTTYTIIYLKYSLSFEVLIDHPEAAQNGKQKKGLGDESKGKHQNGTRVEYE